METLELPYAVLEYDEPIILITFKDKAELGYFEIRELTSACEELSGGTPYFVLSDVRTRVGVTPQGRRLATDKKAAPLNKATAVLIDSTMMKIAANFFGKISRPDYPCKAFTNKHQALGWLRELCEHQGYKEPKQTRKRA